MVCFCCVQPKADRGSALCKNSKNCKYSEYTQLHPMKGTMERPVVMVPLLVYTDDTSGNRSKKWNKFDQWCFMLAGLPHSENAQMHNIHFVTCSNQASATDMMGDIVTDLKQLGGDTCI